MTGADEAASEPASEPAPPLVEPAAVTLMLVRLGGRCFGIDARMIREVAIKGAVTRVPTAPGHVLGVVSLRGTLVPVISLEQMVGGIGPVARDMTATLPRLVVVQAGENAMAVVVDEVRGIVSCAALPAVAKGEAERPAFMREELAWQGETICLVDVPLLIATAAGQAEGSA